MTLTIKEEWPIDILADFGIRVKELRSKCGMSQEVLAARAEIDRSYIGGLERGTRNVSLKNIEKIAYALDISVEYLFSDERFSTTMAYIKKDFDIPFAERFMYHMDTDKKLLSWQINGALSGKEVEKMTSILINICSSYQKDELQMLVDQRSMKSDGQPIVYSPEVVEKAIMLQKQIIAYSNQVVVLCNSQFMVSQLDHITKVSGAYDKASHVFGTDNQFVKQAFSKLDIRANDLVTL